MPSYPTSLPQLILIGSTLLVASVDAVGAKLQFKSYDPVHEQLRMVLVTPSTYGDFLLGQGDKTKKVDGAVLEGLFTLKVQIPCEALTSTTRAYWAVSNHPMLSADIPAQGCERPPLFPPVYIFDRQGVCLLNSNGNTLWHTAQEYSRVNHASVYQNMYALFLANRNAFAKEDIYRLTTPLLRCPTDQQLAAITPEHARALFGDAEQFHHAHATRPAHHPTPIARGPTIHRDQTPLQTALAGAPLPGAPAMTAPRGSTSPAPASTAPCLVNTQGATLWHTAEAYRQQHGITVYQAIFAFYQANPHAFAHGDITRLTVRLLRCPDPAQHNQLPPQQAKQWYLTKIKR